MTAKISTFTVPTIDDQDTLFLGNYIAHKRKGYYNCNKVSWHVQNVIWITGCFPTDDNLDIDFASNVTAKLPTSNDNLGTLVSCGNYAYLITNHMGDMDKTAAKALMQKHYKNDNNVTVSYQCVDYDITTAIKVSTQKITLV